MAEIKINIKETEEGLDVGLHLDAEHSTDFEQRFGAHVMSEITKVLAELRDTVSKGIEDD